MHGVGIAREFARIALEECDRPCGGSRHGKIEHGPGTVARCCPRRPEPGLADAFAARLLIVVFEQINRRIVKMDHAGREQTFFDLVGQQFERKPLSLIQRHIVWRERSIPERLKICSNR